MKRAASATPGQEAGAGDCVDVDIQSLQQSSRAEGWTPVAQSRRRGSAVAKPGQGLLGGDSRSSLSQVRGRLGQRRKSDMDSSHGRSVRCLVPDYVGNSNPPGVGLFSWAGECRPVTRDPARRL